MASLYVKQTLLMSIVYVFLVRRLTSWRCYIDLFWRGWVGCGVRVLLDELEWVLFNCSKKTPGLCMWELFNKNTLLDVYGGIDWKMCAYEEKRS